MLCFVLVLVVVLFPPATAQAECEQAQVFYDQAMAKGVDRAERIRLLEQSVAACDSFAAYFELGRAYASGGDRQQWLPPLRKAILYANNTTEKAWVFHTMARLYKMAHDAEEALLSYKTSLGFAANREVEREMLQMEKATRGGLVSAAHIRSTLTKGLASRSVGVVAAIDVRVQFAFDDATLSASGEQQAAEIGKALADPELQGKRFRIIGHTDSRGTDVYNLRLSHDRAAAVQRYLVTHFTLTPDTITVEGKGKQALLYHDNTEEAHALNRRVEVRVQ